ncbi:MAG TPA: hypothetical protein VKV28_08095 [Candidatus Binataceae bacterium]|nr:hypothetical protein [Candidatus Binataceae bacterium]
MRRGGIYLGLIAIVALVSAGCGHYLRASGGQTSVAVYPDEATFVKVKSLEGQGGPMAIVGNLGENVLAKRLDDRTRVRIISRDHLGAQIEVIEGPNKGYRGFVPKSNLG